MGCCHKPVEVGGGAPIHKRSGSMQQFHGSGHNLKDQID
jgi:hypothetical protein